MASRNDGPEHILDRYPMDGARVFEKRPKLFQATREDAPFQVTTRSGKVLEGAAGDYRVLHADGDVGIIAAHILADRSRYIPDDVVAPEGGPQRFWGIARVRALQHPVDGTSVHMRTLEGPAEVRPGDWVLQGGDGDQWAIDDTYVDNYLLAPRGEQRGVLPTRAALERELVAYLAQDHPHLQRLMDALDGVLGTEVSANEVVDRVRLHVAGERATNGDASPISDRDWAQVHAYVGFATSGSTVQDDALRIVASKQGSAERRRPRLLARGADRLSPGLPVSAGADDLAGASLATLRGARTELSSLEGCYAVLAKLGRVRQDGYLLEPLGTSTSCAEKLLRMLVERQPDPRSSREPDGDERFEHAAATMVEEGKLSTEQVDAVRCLLKKIDFALVLRDLDEGFGDLYRRTDWTDSASGPGRLRTTTAIRELATFAQQLPALGATRPPLLSLLTGGRRTGGARRVQANLSGAQGTAQQGPAKDLDRSGARARPSVRSAKRIDGSGGPGGVGL